MDEWLVQTVMAMCTRACTVVRTKDGNNAKYEVYFEVHQVLFMIVMDVFSQNV